MLVSMDIGVCGYLSLWGRESTSGETIIYSNKIFYIAHSDLDPTTVVNILMSIGLCIDFATHVGYRTYRSRRVLSIKYEKSFKDVAIQMRE